MERLRGLGATTVSLAHTEPDAMAAALGAAVDEAPPPLVLDYAWGPVAEGAFRALERAGGNDVAGVSYVQIGSLGGTEAASLDS